MKNLDDIRVEINAVDEELQALIIKRLDLAKDVAEYKKANNLPILDRDRELWILDHITEDKSPDLVVPLRETYETLFRVARRRRAERRFCRLDRASPSRSERQAARVASGSGQPW